MFNVDELIEMPRIKKPILETGLGKKIMFVLLKNKDKKKMTGYRIGKEVFNNCEYTNLNKTYKALKELEKLNLIERKIVKFGTKEFSFNRVNFKGLANYLNSKLPNDKKLNKKELDIFVKFLQQIDYKKITENMMIIKNRSEIKSEIIPNYNFDNAFGLLLGTFAIAGLNFKNKENIEKKNILKEYYPIYDTIFMSTKLPTQLLEKIKYLSKKIIDDDISVILETSEIALKLSSDLC